MSPPLHAVYRSKVSEPISVLALFISIHHVPYTLQELILVNRIYLTVGTYLLVIPIGVIVPYVHVVINKVLDVGVTLQKPQEFVYDALVKHFLCREQWKTILEVKPHAPSKY